MARIQNKLLFGVALVGAIVGSHRVATATSFDVVTATAGIDFGTAGLSPDGLTLYGSFLPSQSDAGRVVNDTSTTGQFSWTASGGLVSLPFVRSGPIQYAAIRGSSYNGSVLVGQMVDGFVKTTTFGQVGLATGSVKWTSSGVSEVLPVGTSGNASGVVSRATAVSDDGSVIVGYEDPDNNEATATTVSFGGVGASHFNVPMDVGFQNYTGYSQGFMQTPTGTEVLKDYGLVADGRNVSQATAVTPNGQYAFGIARDGTNSSSQELFALTRWDSSGNPTELEPLGIDSAVSAWDVQAVSADGNTIIGTGGIGDGFVWKANGSGEGLFTEYPISDVDPMSMNGAGTFIVGNLSNYDNDGSTLFNGPVVLMGGSSVGEPLGTYLNSVGVSFPGFTLDTVDGMSRDGSVLSGTGHYTGQATEYAWEADLNVPEPGAFVLVGGCLALLMNRRVRGVR